MGSKSDPKEFNRRQRLKAAEKKEWLSNYRGKNLIRKYSLFFNVNLKCAVEELEMLNCNLDSECKNEVLEYYEAKLEADLSSREQPEVLKDCQDMNYYYIAGYTSGGAPYGITWEEYERNIKDDDEKLEKEEDNNFFELDDFFADAPPF